MKPWLALITGLILGLGAALLLHRYEFHLAPDTLILWRCDTITGRADYCTPGEGSYWRQIPATHADTLLDAYAPQPRATQPASR